MKYLRSTEGLLEEAVRSLRVVMTEMSDTVIKHIVSDDGLSGKLTKGKLSHKDGWVLGQIEYLEGPHGEAQYEHCDNCGKSIRYVCHLISPEEKQVGPDCALSLLTGKDYETVEKYVGVRRKRVDFVRKIISWLDDETKALTDAEVSAFNDGVNVIKQGKMGKVSPDVHIDYHGLGIEFQSKLFKEHDKVMSLATKQLWQAVIKKKTADLVKHLESAFDNDKKSLKDKKYFFDMKKGDSGFLSDNEDLLSGIGRDNLNMGYILRMPEA